MLKKKSQIVDPFITSILARDASQPLTIMYDGRFFELAVGAILNCSTPEACGKYRWPSIDRQYISADFLVEFWLSFGLIRRRFANFLPQVRLSFG